MRSVFKRIGRAATLSLVVVLLTTAAAAAPPGECGKNRLIDRIVVWLQGRISIPPGNS